MHKNQDYMFNRTWMELIFMLSIEECNLKVINLEKLLFIANKELAFYHDDVVSTRIQQWRVVL